MSATEPPRCQAQAAPRTGRRVQPGRLRSRPQYPGRQP